MRQNVIAGKVLKQHKYIVRHGHLEPRSTYDLDISLNFTLIGPLDVQLQYVDRRPYELPATPPPPNASFAWNMKK